MATCEVIRLGGRDGREECGAPLAEQNPKECYSCGLPMCNACDSGETVTDRRYHGGVQAKREAPLCVTCFIGREVAGVRSEYDSRLVEAVSDVDRALDKCDLAWTLATLSRVVDAAYFAQEALIRAEVRRLRAAEPGCDEASIIASLAKRTTGWNTFRSYGLESYGYENDYIVMVKRIIEAEDKARESVASDEADTARESTSAA